MAERNVNGPYEPTILDVLVVREMLNRGLGLLPELIDDVFDWAEYWPHSTAVGSYEPGFRLVTGGSRHGQETLFLVGLSPAFTFVKISVADASYRSALNPWAFPSTLQ